MRGLGAECFTGPGVAAQEGAGFDVIIDTVGGAALAASYGLMRPGGRLVTLGAPPSQDRAASSGVRTLWSCPRRQPAAGGLDWTYISPAALFAPGERTGTYRAGGDDLLTDADGNSRISVGNTVRSLRPRAEVADRHN
ncbi:MAG: 3-beta hydroxysteroid dehydrogenase [Actinomycetia bacterium]|nr:3-beta hydroxysteroid dehydrogenase [Actinomycetes bacterium]